MFLNSLNMWAPCTLLEMVSLELCDVAVDGRSCDVPTAIMAENVAVLSGTPSCF